VRFHRITYITAGETFCTGMQSWNKTKRLFLLSIFSLKTLAFAS
jgi:hypothetical protein